MNQGSTSGLGMPPAAPSRDAVRALATELRAPAPAPLVPRSFLPEFADEGNHVLDQENRVRPSNIACQSGQGSQYVGAAPTRLPPHCSAAVVVQAAPCSPA